MPSGQGADKVTSRDALCYTKHLKICYQNYSKFHKQDNSSLGPTHPQRQRRTCVVSSWRHTPPPCRRPHFFPRRQGRVRATPTLEIIEECPRECNSEKKQLACLAHDSNQATLLTI